MFQVRKNKITLLALLVSILLVSSLFTGCGGGKAPADSSKQSGSSAPAADSAKKSSDSFPSKDITFIVPVTPGGGFDTYSRLLVQYLPKYLPNKVNVIVKNVPGGEWNIGIMEINKAKPDGYTIGIFNVPGNIVNQVMGTEYDLTKMTWIGRITNTVYIGALSPKSKYKTFEDMKNAKEPVKVGVVGLSSSAGLGSLLAFEEMKIPAKYITHPGSSEAIMAAVRGDVDYVQYPYPSLKKFIIDSKQLNPIVTFAPERYMDLKDVPTIKEKGFPQILDVARMDYLVGGTPGIPDDVAKILRDAFQKAVKDPEFLDKMQKAGQPANPASAEDAAASVKSSLDTFAKYKDLVAKNMK